MGSFEDATQAADEPNTKRQHTNTFGGTVEIAHNNFADDLDAIATLDEPWLHSSSATTSNRNYGLGRSSSSSSSGSVWSSWPRPCDDDDFTLGWSKRQNQRIPSSSTRKAIYHSVQVLSILICLFGTYTLVINIISLAKVNPESPQTSKFNGSVPDTNIRELLKTWTTEPEPEQREKFSTAISSDKLLDISNFHFLLNNVSICAPRPRTPRHYNVIPPNGDAEAPAAIVPGQGVYFMIVVHSAPDHFAERQAIRSTWGSVKTLKNWAIRLVFLLGSESESGYSAMSNESISRESFIFGDIVSGNFHDSYRNLTYKHLMGYRWALSFCPGATFVLKTDDDAFIDIFQLFEFTSRTYGFSPEGTLVCNVFPEGTKPVRTSDPEAEAAGKKWIVTQEEYPHDKYPKYCGGLAYLITPDILERIVSVSEKSRFFWIDDVYVTGVLRELVDKEPYYLNLRYSYEPEEYRKWLEDRRPRRIPFMIVHVERGPKFSKEMNHLWRKTMRVWS